MSMLVNQQLVVKNYIEKKDCIPMVETSRNNSFGLVLLADMLFGLVVPLPAIPITQMTHLASFGLVSVVKEVVV